jgi:hypothetical protein
MGVLSYGQVKTTSEIPSGKVSWASRNLVQKKCMHVRTDIRAASHNTSPRRSAQKQKHPNSFRGLFMAAANNNRGLKVLPGDAFYG